MKRCSRCGQTKSLAEFPPSKEGSQGRLGYCHTCHAEYQRELRRAGRLGPRKRKQASNKKWFERWAEAHPEKVRAHRMVRQAVRSGRLVKPTSCPRCRSTKQIIGHHADYDKPLDVEWMCGLCHNDLHGNPKVAGSKEEEWKKERMTSQPTLRVKDVRSLVDVSYQATDLEVLRLRLSGRH